LNERVSLTERLDLPDGVLSRTDLRDLGYERRAVDGIFREAARRRGVIHVPGYSRSMIGVRTYREILADSTHGDDRVGPVTRASR
jgi:hypothetical protein